MKALDYRCALCPSHPTVSATHAHFRISYGSFSVWERARAVGDASISTFDVNDGRCPREHAHTVFHTTDASAAQDFALYAFRREQCGHDDGSIRPCSSLWPVVELA